MEILFAIIVAWVGFLWLKRLWQNRRERRRAARIASEVNAVHREIGVGSEALRELKVAVATSAVPSLLDTAPVGGEGAQPEGESGPEPESPTPSEPEEDLDYRAFVAATWRKAAWTTPPGNLPAIVDGEECRLASFTPRPGGNIYVNLWLRGEPKTFVASHHEWEINGAPIKPAALVKFAQSLPKTS
jgi:hypothetical protein